MFSVQNAMCFQKISIRRFICMERGLSMMFHVSNTRVRLLQLLFNETFFTRTNLERGNLMDEGVVMYAGWWRESLGVLRQIRGFSLKILGSPSGFRLRTSNPLLL